VDRRKKSRANREQLRCCNWIRLPNWANPQKFFGGEGGKKVIPAMPEQTQEPEYLSGLPHSAVAAIGDRGGGDQRSRLQRRPEKLLRKKKNESWAIR
jgi:hypothetical protein